MNRQYVFVFTQIGNRATFNAIISDDIKGGSSVPARGEPALSSAIGLLDTCARLVAAGQLTLIDGMVDGRDMHDILRERAALEGAPTRFD